jgi:hypothetical protein
MRQHAAFPRLIGAALIVAAIAACSRGPESPPEPTEQVGVITASPGLPTAEQSPVLIESITHALVDERTGESADPSEQPYRDLAEDPNSDPSGGESPGPQRNGTTSAIGIGGGMAGGGGRGGRGGFEHRRARGGGGIPRRHDDRTRAALEWLADHQNSSGCWRPADFPADSSRRIAAARGSATTDGTIGKGDAAYEIEATCWAVLAFTGAGYDHKEGDYKRTLLNAAVYLKCLQRNDGGVGKAVDETL